jgi:hypothetical protein
VHYNCTLFSPNSANLALNMVLFDALVLMSLPEFITDITSINFSNYNAKLAPNIMQICPK